MDGQNSSFTEIWKKHAQKKQANSGSVVIEANQGLANSGGAATRESGGWQRVHVNRATATEPPAPSASTVAQSNMIRQHFWQKKRFWYGVGGVVISILLVLGALGLLAYNVYAQAQGIRAEAEQAVAEAQAVYTSFKAQNLPESRVHMTAAGTHLNNVQDRYRRLQWMKMIPLAKRYYEDGQHGLNAAVAGVAAGHKVLDAIEPHADLLGFKGEGTFAGTTQDRIGLVLQTLDQISPALDGIAADIDVVQNELAQIDPSHYPESWQGKPVRQYIAQAQAGALAAEVALGEARPALEQLPEIAGAAKRRKYLVIFQNDNELRPTGGFMTAYAVVNVEKGQVTSEKSDDIYEMDKKFRLKPAIPEKLGRFLVTERSWNLRDMNIDPNFKNSMSTFYEYYQTVPGEFKDIDGIIAVDTVLLEKVVNVLGPIEVPGYGTFSAQKLANCDCPQIIYVLSEIIDRPTPYHRENRKGILAPMMQAIIAKTYATPRDKWPDLAQILWEGIAGRHVQFYFLNEADQTAAEAINAAGIIPSLDEEADYLTVIDANLAGAKSNLFVETSGVINVLDWTDGQLRKEVELTYRNTHPPSNCNLEAGQLCLNGMLNDWTRWYLPKGAQIENVIGLEAGYKLDTTNPDYDLLEGVFKLAPNSQTKVRVTYRIPWADDPANGMGYALKMQKQGGTDPIPYEIVTPWGETTAVLDKDVLVKIKQ